MTHFGWSSSVLIIVIIKMADTSKTQWVAVESAGPYASLQLAPDRQPHQHPTTQFLQAVCPSCRPTNSVKALKA